MMATENNIQSPTATSNPDQDHVKDSDDSATNEVDNILNLTLVEQAIDNEIVKRISVNRTINAVVVELNNGTASSTIHFEDFSGKTIKPTEKRLGTIIEQ